MEKLKALRVRTGSWDADVREFLGETEALVQEVRLVKNHPGWEDLAGIISAHPSVKFIEGHEAARKKSEVALAEWSTKWDADGARFLVLYSKLADRSRNLMEQREALLTQWRTLQGDYSRSSVVFGWKTRSRGRPAVIRAQEARYPEEGELNRFSLDPLGLLQRE